VNSAPGWASVLSPGRSSRWLSQKSRKATSTGSGFLLHAAASTSSTWYSPARGAGGAGVASVTEERVALPPDDDTDGA
jgi:hypothetical protein